MTPARALAACALAAVAAGPATAAAADPARFAIVVGHNEPDAASRQPLAYADDDAVAMHELLASAGVDSRLFADLDPSTAALYPGSRARGAPSWAALERELERIEDAARRARRQGRRTELWFFYSGHGDVANGEGYVVLEDRRLTRSLLHERVLAIPGVDRNHVVIDACRSYFLAFGKGPETERRRYHQPFARPARPRASGDTGFILSTSSDRESHEWERLQGGVFSHEVRSALRGAADADRDRAISYAEVGAFLATANAGIVNPRLRPDVAVLPPGSLAEPLLEWRGGPEEVVVEGALGHVFVENARGVRLVDAHAAPGETLALRLPRERPAFVRDAGETVEYELPEGGARVSALAPRSPLVAAKGAVHLAFRQLFSEPFGPEAVARFREGWREAPPRARWSASLARRPEPGEPAPPVRERVRRLAGWTAAVAAVTGVASAVWAVERRAAGDGASQRERARLNGHIAALNTTALVAGGVAAAAGATWLGAVLWPEQDDPSLSVSPAGEGGAAVGIRGTW